MASFNNSVYFNFRISSLIIEYLIRNGVEIERIPKSIASKKDLIEYLAVEGFDDSSKLVNDAINYAFDKKYFNYYSVSKDVYQFGDGWIRDFHEVLKKLGLDEKLNELTILNVGCNDGSQMEKLIGSNYGKLYLVDVAIRSLHLAKDIYPDSIIMHSSADMLAEMPDGSIDLYLSFKTFNSSLFDIESSVLELNRVLADGGSVVLSIPNGYVDDGQKINYGLKPPGEDYVDEYYPFKVIGVIIYELSKNGFKDIGILNSFYEIYIYSKK